MTAVLAAAVSRPAAAHHGVRHHVVAVAHGLDKHVSSGDVATVVAAVLAAFLAAWFGVRAYRRQQQEARRNERARFYAEAVRAVEDYCEAPYRILRKDGSAQARRELTQHVSDIKSRISFFCGWMAIHATAPVAQAYDAYVKAAQTEAGAQMTAAWRARPVKRDRNVPLGAGLPRPRTDAARDALLDELKKDLGR